MGSQQNGNYISLFLFKLAILFGSICALAGYSVRKKPVSGRGVSATGVLTWRQRERNADEKGENSLVDGGFGDVCWACGSGAGDHHDRD